MQFHQGSVAASGLSLNSEEFGYSIGVLHHVPHTAAAAIRSFTELFKLGVLPLVYLYHDCDNRPRCFLWHWRVSNTVSQLIPRLPPRPKNLITDLFALPSPALVRVAVLADLAGVSMPSFPLSYYRCSLYKMRPDARDRFGTPLEQHFIRAKIRAMCSTAGLVDLLF